MNRIVVWALSISLIGWTFLSAEEKKSSPAPAVRARLLIDQLSSPDFDVREQAFKALEAFGPTALDDLKKAQDHADPEVRRRIGQLIPVLENAILLAPKRVTLNLKQRPIRDAVAELSKQTGYKINLQESPSPSKTATPLHDFQLENVLFWQAFHQVCVKGGLFLREDNGTDNLNLSYEERRLPFVHLDGLFRVTAKGFDYSRNLHFGNLPRNATGIGQLTENLSFSFSVTVEPRLRLLGLGRARASTATDNQDRTMVPIPVEGFEDDFDRHSYGYNRGLAQHGQLNLIRPSPESRHVKQMKGVIPVIILVKQVPLIVIENPLTVKGKTVKAEDTELTLREIKKPSDKNYRVSIHVSRVNADSIHPGAWWSSLPERIVLQDEQGNKYESGGGGWSGNQNTIDGEFSYHAAANAKIGPPVKLIYYSWVTLRHHVAFEFKDLPLP